MDNRKSSLAIGRRTRTNVLKDKEIRKDKDGCDIFEDYWTDSGDDQSSCHSQSSYAAISAKSMKDIGQSDSGNGDSGSKLREANKSPTCRISESDHDKSGSSADENIAEILTVKSQRFQMQKSLHSDLSVSKPSLSKNRTFRHDELGTKSVNRMQRETYLNDTENQPDETAVLDNPTSPRNSTMISKQSNVLNFNDASEIDEFSDGVIPSTSGTVNISRKILKSPKRISRKHIFDLMNSRNLEGTEFGVLKSVSPLSKVINKTITLSDKDNLRNAFGNSYQHLNDPPRDFTKLNKSSKTKLLSGTSSNSTFNKNPNARKSVEKHKIKTRSAVEIEKILSNYDEYDARIMQIIRENNEDNQKSSEKVAPAIRMSGEEKNSLNGTTSNDTLVLKETIKHSSSNEANRTRILKNHIPFDASDKVSHNKMPPHASQGKNNTMILSKRDKDLSTLKSFENTDEENYSEKDLFKDISSKADEVQTSNNINASEKVSANPVLVSKPKSNRKSKERKKYKNIGEDDSKQIKIYSEGDAVKMPSNSMKRKKQISHTEQKNIKDTSALKEVFDSEQDTNYLSPRKNKPLKLFKRFQQIEESSSEDHAIENTSISRKRRVKQKISKYVPENVTVSKARNNVTEQINRKEKSTVAAEVDGIYEFDANDQSELITLKYSESGVSCHKSVNLPSLNKNNSSKSLERSKQIDEESSSEDNTTSENVLMSRNRIMQKVSKNQNIPQKVHEKSIKDKSATKEVEGNYDSDTNDQSEHLAMVDSESGVSPHNLLSLLKKNQSLKSLEKSKQDYEESSEDSTSATVPMSRNMKKFSKNKKIPPKVHQNITNKTKSPKDRSAIAEVQGNYDADTNDQSEHLAMVDSESGVSPHKSVALSYLKQNKSLESLERSKQTYEESSEDGTSATVSLSRNRKMRKVSKNKNVSTKVYENITVNKTKSTKDRNAIKEVQGNYDTDTNDPSEHLTIVDTESGTSHKPVDPSYLKNKSLKSLERSKQIEESSEDSDVENTPRNSSKRLKVTKSSHGMLLENTTTTSKTKINVDTEVDKEVSEMEIDIGHQCEHPILNTICPEQNVSLHKNLDPLSSKKRRVRPKLNHSVAVSKKVTTETISENLMRKSNRQRYAPLAHWRNERLLYRFEKGLVKVLGVTEGTKEDNLHLLHIKKQHRDNKIQGKRSHKVKKASIYDSINNKKVKISLVNTYSSVPWELPTNVAGSSHYRIKRVLESTNCAFGFVEIDIHSSKPSQYMPAEDLQMTMIKGDVEVVVQENSFRVTANDMFFVPRNTAYTLKNLGHTKALLTYAVGKFKFLESALHT